MEDLIEPVKAAGQARKAKVAGGEADVGDLRPKRARITRASVDRTFLYRHRDLLGKIHALEAAPPASGGTASPAVTCASLQADLLAAHERCVRLNVRVRQLEKRLSEALGTRHSASPGSAPPPTPRPSASRSPTLSSRSSTCASSSKNKARTSPPPGPPTARSWPSSGEDRINSWPHQK